LKFSGSGLKCGALGNLRAQVERPVSVCADCPVRNLGGQAPEGFLAL
jgi:hypothetical protein